MKLSSDFKTKLDRHYARQDVSTQLTLEYAPDEIVETF
jgi:hypothetical protein